MSSVKKLPMDDLTWLDDIPIENEETIDPRSIDYAEMLLDTCGLSPENKASIQLEINDCLFNFELYDIINRLKDAQVDRIDGGLNYNQTDIKRKLKLIDDNDF